MSIRRLAAAAAFLLAPAWAAAQRTDVIRGRVTGPNEEPVAGVSVAATSYVGGVSKPGRTDRNGRYTIVFPNGEGDYWVAFNAIGFLPRRFQVKRVADEEVLIADVKLASSIAALDAVNISANAPRALPARTDATADLSGTDRQLGNAAMSAELAGNLAAAAALNPGVQLIPGLDGAPDAFTALGIAADQNSTTFNGLGASLSSLPRDAQVNASVRTFNYDPSIGGFGGGQIAIAPRPGSNFSSRTMSGVGRGPATEFTSSVAEEQGAKNTFLSAGGGGSGPIRMDQAFYNASYQVDRDFRDLRSVLNTSDVALAAAGVARDSADRLLSILAANGIPARLDASPALQATDRVTVQGNVDLTPRASGIGHAFSLGAAANLLRTASSGAGLGSILTTPAHNAEARLTAVNLSVRHSNYFGFGVLSTTTIGFARTSSRTEPYLRLPHGTVRVTSQLEDGGGASAIRTLSFGGNPADQSSRNSTVEALNQMTWYEGRNRHAVKLSTSVRYERHATDQSSALLGSFSFRSLADLEAGRPEYFERLLAPRRVDGGQVTGSIALGDAWRPSTNVQILYGARVDANRLTSAPRFNQAVADSFGFRNDRMPNRAEVSPRLGFQWFLGHAPQLSLLAAGARPPRTVVQGGMGVFQNVASAAALTNVVVNNTGLHDGSLTIRCIGSVAPIPDWTAYRTDQSAIPDQCTDGSPSSLFGISAPNVSMYDPGYRQARVLRSNVGMGFPAVSNRLAVGLSLQFQRGFDQPSASDLNLDASTRFTLADEAGRPVFASPDAIVPATGAIASRVTRRFPSFNRVSLIASNLQQQTVLANVSVRPVTTGTLFNWTMSYSLQSTREQFLGFTSTTGDPFERHWGGALEPRRHTFTATMFYNVFDVVRFNALVVVVSGVRFTPSVLGDVNGDGYATNDRAFVFDPAIAPDAAMAAGMRRLIDGSAPAGRRCLESQRDALSTRGSCAGPWQSTANLNIGFNSQKVRLPQRMRVGLSLNNPLLLADLLIHGERDMRGWGQMIAPDQTLLAVRGFDPSTRRFRYEVNERFGSTRPTQTVQRAQTFLSVQVNYDIGPSRERQVLTQRLDAGRRQPGVKQGAPALRTLGIATIPNPIRLILQQGDSLGLSRAQADSLVLLNRGYTVLADSLWTDAAAYLATVPDAYDRDDAYRRYVHAREQTIDHLIAIVPRITRVLTPAQRRKLPQAIRDWLDVRVLRAIRSSTSG